MKNVLWLTVVVLYVLHGCSEVKMAGVSGRYSSSNASPKPAEHEPSDSSGISQTGGEMGPNTQSDNVGIQPNAPINSPSIQPGIKNDTNFPEPELQLSINGTHLQLLAKPSEPVDIAWEGKNLSPDCTVYIPDQPGPSAEGTDLILVSHAGLSGHVSYTPTADHYVYVFVKCPIKADPGVFYMRSVSLMSWDRNLFSVNAKVNGKQVHANQILNIPYAKVKVEFSANDQTVKCRLSQTLSGGVIGTVEGQTGEFFYSPNSAPSSEGFSLSCTAVGGYEYGAGFFVSVIPN